MVFVGSLLPNCQSAADQSSALLIVPGSFNAAQLSRLLPVAPTNVLGNGVHSSNADEPNMLGATITQHAAAASNSFFIFQSSNLIFKTCALLTQITVDLRVKRFWHLCSIRSPT